MAEHDEAYYMEQFGVNPPETDTDTTEVSENPEETPESVRDTETPAPNEEETAETEQDSTDSAEETEGAPPKAKQSRSQNRHYAAARREAERQRDDAIAAEREKAKQDMDALIADMGLTNPYTDKPITSKAEYDEYKATHESKQQEKRLKDMDMTQEQFDEFVGNLPEVKEARRIAEESQQARYKEQMRRELEEVTALNPAIKTAQDLLNDPKWNEMSTLVNERNYALADAYKLVHYDELTTRKSTQQAINRQGKSHMTSTQQRGGEGLPTVPSDELSMFHRLLPDVSDDEIARFYSRMTRGS